MGEDFEVIGRIVVDSSGAVGIQAVNSQLKTMGEQTTGLGGITQKLGSIMDFVWGNLIARGIEMAMEKLKEFVTSSLDAAKNHQVIEAQLANQIKNTGAATGMTAAAVENLATKYAALTGFTKDQIIAGETQLLTFQKVNANIFPQAASLAMDLARQKGLDLTNTFQLLGRALGDPAMGIGRLNMQFRLFDKDQIKTIEDMAKSGDVMGAQKIIIDALTAKVGGAAEAYGSTFAGKMAIFNAQLEELKISVGNFLIPIMSRFMGLFLQSGVIDGLQKFFDALDSGSIKIPILNQALAFFGSWWKTNGPAITAAGNKILDALRNMIAILTPMITRFAQEILPQIEAWFKDNGPLIQKVATEIADVFTYIIVPAVTIAIAMILPLLDNAINIILQLATVIMAVATGDWPTAWNAIKAIALDVWKGITGALMSGAAALVKLVGGTPNNISVVWTNDWNAFLTIIGKLISIAIQTVENTVGDWVQAGIDLMNGLITGIENTIQSVIDTVTGAINQVVNTVKNNLHISSPSKVFADIGKSMMQGMAVGIGDGLTIPVSAMVKGLPRLNAAAALGSSQTTYYGGNTSYSRKMHFGSVNNYYVSQRPGPSEIAKSQRMV